MDEEQAAYQSEQTESIESQETHTEAAETATTQETAAPEGFTVKYNKEDRFVGKDEAPTWIQKGLNYDKVHERAQQLEGQTKYLERQARISGYDSVDEYMTALDQYEQNQQIEQEARRMGLDPELYAEHLHPVKAELNEVKKQLQSFQQQQSESEKRTQSVAQWNDLYSAYPVLSETSQAFGEGKAPEWLTPQMQELVDAGYKPIHAYELAHKETLFRQKEQEVLANVTGRGAKQILPSVDQPNNMQFNPADMSFDQIQELSRRARSGERITFD